MRTYKYNSELLPSGFHRGYDAHLYFDSNTFPIASAFRERMVEKFAAHSKIFIGQMIPEPIGPHPLPMFEVNFSEEDYDTIVNFLKEEHGDIPVLVHKLTGDDIVDHTTEAFWIGTTLSLNFSVFQAKF